MGFVLAFFQHLKTIAVSQTEIIHLSDTKQTTFFLGGSSIIFGEKCHSFLWLQTAIFLLKEKILENFDQQFDKNVFEIFFIY